MKKTLMQLNGWICSHPLQSTGYSSLLTLLACLIGYHEDWLLPKVVCALLLITFGISLARYCKTITSVLLVTALLALPYRAKSTPPPIKANPLAGVLVIVVGIVVVVKLIRFCKDHFPCNGETNSNRSFVAYTEYRGAWIFDDGCEIENSIYPPVTCSVTGIVQGNSVVDVSSHLVGYQGLESFQAEQLAHGIIISPGVTNATCSINGQPCLPSQSPLSFDYQTHTVTLTGGNRRVLIEESADLRSWQPVVAVVVPDGAKLKIEDTTQTTGTFYRMSVVH